MALLTEAFPAAESLFVEREFRSGYSGALVLMISVDSGRAPVVVKLAHPRDLQSEFDAYHRFVRDRAPQNTARLHGAPILSADAQLGLLVYAFAGGDTQHPSSSLLDYFTEKGGAATCDVLNRIFRVYGRHWWAINRPRKYVLAEEYDRLLPVHLHVDAIDGALVQAVVITAGESSALDLRTLEIGTFVELQNFEVTSVDPEAGSLRLTAQPPWGEATASLRIRLHHLPDFPALPGARISSIIGMVSATRHSLLHEIHGRAFSTAQPSAPSMTVDVEDPVQRPLLKQLDGWLDQVVEARFSTIHGDLNLQNVLVDQPTGFAWLIDFADTREGPTLFDLQRLEVQIITKLMRDEGSQELSAEMAGILRALHADPPRPNAPHGALQEPYALLCGLRRLCRQYLMDDLDWDEYYLGLIVALIGALKYEELPDQALRCAWVAAATLQELLGVAPSTDSAPASVVAAPQIEIPDPPEPARPPQFSGFVGRDQELVYFAERLEEQGLAVISGMAGVGKSALAANLAAWVARPPQIFWYSCHEGDGIEILVWKLAAYLAYHGQRDLWQLLESTRLTAGQPPSAETLLDYLMQLLRGRKVLLCIDDFQFVEEDPRFNQLIERLLATLPQGGYQLLITTRRMPDFAAAAGTRPLGGLEVADARRLLNARGITLEDSALQALHELTAGNAQFLTLAANILQQAADPAQLIDRLAETDDIERYLLARVDEGLNGSERSVMGGIAIFLGYPASRDAIESVLNAGNVWRTIRLLQDRHLLVETEGEEGREYIQHAIVRSFYYQEAGRRQRRIMHQRAGEYYEQEEPDLLRSGIHYERATAFALAAKQATADVWAIINRGQARVLRRLLEAFRRDQLESLQWGEVTIAKGVTYAFLDERMLAGESYQTALAELEPLPKSARVDALKSKIYGGLAELLELEKPAEALAWLERGIEELPELLPEDDAALWIKCGAAQLYLGNYDDAQAALERGLTQLAATPSQLRSIALANLGSVAFFRGDLESSLQHNRAALQICEALHDQFRMINVLSNIAISSYCQGEWQIAIQDFKQALALANRLGSEKLQAEVEINLGAAYINTGDDELAAAHLERSRQLAAANDLHVVETFAQFRQADLNIRRQQWAEAALHLMQAERLANAIQHRTVMIAIHCAWAEIRLAADDVEGARVATQEAMSLADELEEALEKGAGLRILGQIQERSGERRQALESLEASLLLLADEDPYEAARTMAVLSKIVIETDHDEARRLAHRARTIFRNLDAKRDLAALEENA